MLFSYTSLKPNCNVFFQDRNWKWWVQAKKNLSTLHKIFHEIFFYIRWVLLPMFRASAWQVVSAAPCTCRQFALWANLRRMRVSCLSNSSTNKSHLWSMNKHILILIYICLLTRNAICLLMNFSKNDTCTLLKLAHAANYLQVEGALDTICDALAQNIGNNSQDV